MGAFVPMDSESAAYVMSLRKKNLEILTFFIFTVRVSCQSSSSENCTVFTSNAFEVEQSLGNIFLNSIPKHMIFIFKGFE